MTNRVPLEPRTEMWCAIEGMIGPKNGSETIQRTDDLGIISFGIHSPTQPPTSPSHIVKYSSREHSNDDI